MSGRSMRTSLIALLVVLYLFTTATFANAQYTWPQIPPIIGGRSNLFIGDYAWLDANDNGAQDTGEPGVQGVKVTLYRIYPAPYSWTTYTTQNGHYIFSDLEGDAVYQLDFDPPVGYTYAKPNVPYVSDLVDSDADPLQGGATQQFYVLGAHQYQWDVGLRISQSNSCATSWTLGNHIWRERTGNAIFDPDTADYSMPGVTVELYEIIDWWGPASTILYKVDDTVTNEQGHYVFACLSSGDYIIVARKVGAYAASPHVRGTGDPNDHFDEDNNLIDASAMIAEFGQIGSTSGQIANVNSTLLGALGASKPIHLPHTSNQGFLESTLDGAISCEGARLDIVLTIDASGSMGEDGKLAAAKQATSQFVTDLAEGGNNLSPKRVGIVIFRNNSSEIWQDFETDVTVINNRITLISSSGGTEIDDALLTSADMLNGRTTLRQQEARGIVILLSDGRQHDSTDPNNYPEVQAAAGRITARYRLLTIAFGSNADRALLQMIASSPLDYFFSPSEAEIMGIYQSIVPRICDPSGAFGFSCHLEGVNPVIVVTNGDAVPGDASSRWTVAQDAQAPSNAVDAAPTPFPWGPPLPGSRWISKYANAAATPAYSKYHYRVAFPLSHIPSKIELRGNAYGDDEILGATLNGHPLLKAGSGNFNGSPAFLFGNEPGNFATSNELDIVTQDTAGGLAGLDSVIQVLGCDNPDPGIPIGQQCAAGIIGGRDAASQYAQQFALNANKCWEKCDNDCTNFLSQCLWIGGIEMDSVWRFGGCNASGGATAWIRTEELVDYLIAHGIADPPIPLDAKLDSINARPGDIILMKWFFNKANPRTFDNRFDHATFVVDSDGQHTLQSCEKCVPIDEQRTMHGTLVSSHTGDRNRVLWNNKWAAIFGPNLGTDFWLLRVHYPSQCPDRGSMCPPTSP